MDDCFVHVLLRLAFNRGSVRGRFTLREGKGKRNGTHHPVEASSPSERCTIPCQLVLVLATMHHRVVTVLIGPG